MNAKRRDWRPFFVWHDARVHNSFLTFCGVNNHDCQPSGTSSRSTQVIRLNESSENEAFGILYLRVKTVLYPASVLASIASFAPPLAASALQDPLEDEIRGTFAQ